MPPQRDKSHLPAEVVYKRPTGVWQLRGPFPRGRHWRHASCGLCKSYVRLSRWGQPRVKIRGDRGTNPRGPDRRVNLSQQETLAASPYLSVNLRVVKTTGGELACFARTGPHLLCKRMVRWRHHRE